MKSWSIFTVLMAACVLMAEELRLTNNLIELRVDNGRVELYAPGAPSPAAVFTPAFASGEVKAFVVDRRDRARKIVRLSTPDASLAIELPDKKPYIRLALNRNASPVKVTMPSGVEAVVLPDNFGEDALLLPGAARCLPAFLPGYLMMLKDGSALTCLPINAHDDAILSQNLNTLTVSQKNTEDYIFVLNAGPDAWHKTTVPDLGTQQTVADWKVPFPALWQVSFAVNPGFVPLGDGLRCNWNIASLDEQGKLTHVAPRFIVTQPQNCYGWLGGFEGNCRYPAVLHTDGALEITNPRFRDGSAQRYDQSQPLYIYAFYSTAYEQHVPANYMEPAMRNQRPFGSTSFATSPATCDVTADFEKIFRREQGAEKREEIIQMLAAMQCFVEGIRARLENGRAWAMDMNVFVAETIHNNPSLAEAGRQLDTMLGNFELRYQAALPRIQSTEKVQELSAQVIALTESKQDPEEIEEQAKKLGSAIRTIGGGQDNLVAEMHHFAKCIRQHAIYHYTLAQTSAEHKFWSEVYRRTEEVLQANFGHDGK